MSGWDKITIPVKDAPPLTPEALQKTFDEIKAQCGRYEPPMRVVSAQVYARAEEAEARRAPRAEIEWILLGASPEQAKEWAGGR